MESPAMHALSRRQLIATSLIAAAARPTRGGTGLDASQVDVHRQLLELAERQEAARRARFEAVRTRADLEGLQRDLRTLLVRAIGDFPEHGGAPPAHATGTIDAADYVVEKLVFESFPGYFVSSLLYRPKQAAGRLPAVLSPCGHSTVGKAEPTYQILHVNLVKRGYVVLTYDPVGQGERSQFWDVERDRSRFNLSCGEHAVLGNPLYLIGTSLARYRTWDGLRALDYLTSRPEVDAARIGCVGNSGGGTLTAYIAALDSRVAAAAICCYVTTLRRRMGNRIQEDPDADPEQDLFGFISAGIDHAGLLALRAPRPTLLGTARFDFFPIEGARETYAEARRLFEVAGAGGCIDRVEAADRHGLTPPLRQAVYRWFERWLNRRDDPATAAEIPVTPRPAKELLAAGGQVNLTFRSRPLLSLALEEFDRKPKPPRLPLRDELGLDPDLAGSRVSEVHTGSGQGGTLIVCVNGNEARDWHEEAGFLGELRRRDYAVCVVDPRGVGQARPGLVIPMHAYADPLVGVEENIAYNAFLVGKSLVGMRVTDVLAAVRQALGRRTARRVVVCGRRDSALVACLAAAIEPSITHVATEELRLSFRALFQAPGGAAINAASILPGLLERFGDVSEVLAEVAPRKILIAAGVGQDSRAMPGARTVRERFTVAPQVLTAWLGD
jgi:cephalosporin-C deacetylase-like acetyl esterase